MEVGPSRENALGLGPFRRCVELVLCSHTVRAMELTVVSFRTDTASVFDLVTARARLQFTRLRRR